MKVISKYAQLKDFDEAEYHKELRQVFIDAFVDVHIPYASCIPKEVK